VVSSTKAEGGDETSRGGFDEGEESGRGGESVMGWPVQRNVMRWGEYINNYSGGGKGRPLRRRETQ